MNLHCHCHPPSSDAFSSSSEQRRATAYSLIACSLKIHYIQHNFYISFLLSLLLLRLWCISINLQHDDNKDTSGNSASKLDNIGDGDVRDNCSDYVPWVHQPGTRFRKEIGHEVETTSGHRHSQCTWPRYLFIINPTILQVG